MTEDNFNSSQLFQMSTIPMVQLITIILSPNPINPNPY